MRKNNHKNIDVINEYDIVVNLYLASSKNRPFDLLHFSQTFMMCIFIMQIKVLEIHSHF